MNIVRVIEFAKSGLESGGENLYDVWRIGSTSQLRGINLKDLQPQSGIYKEKIEKLKCLAAWHGLETHGGGWGKAKLDKLDKSGALQGGTVRVRASRSWARPAPRSELFYLLGRAANRPSPQNRVGASACALLQPRSLRKFRELSILASATNKGLTSHNHETNRERINGSAEPR